MNEKEEKTPRLTRANNSKLPTLRQAAEEHGIDPNIEKRIQMLLIKSVDIRSKMSELKDKLDANKAELSAICSTYDLSGVRHGLAYVDYTPWTTRKTLSKEKLLDAGVSAATIAESYVESKPFEVCEIGVFDVLE